MTLRARLGLGLALIALLLVIPLLVTLGSLGRLQTTAERLREREFAASILVGRLRARVDDLRSAEERFALFPSAETHAALAGSIAIARAGADSLDRFGLAAEGGELGRVLAQVSEAASQQQVVAGGGRRAELDSISLSTQRPLLARAGRLIDRAEARLRANTSAAVETASDEARRSRNGALTAAGLGGVLALLVGIWLIRSISGPVRDLEQGMERVAGGEFGHRLGVRPDRRDEFGRLAASYVEMAAQLAALDRLKAEFISVASHELKTPLNVISGYVQLLEEGVYGPLAPKQDDVLRTVQQQCQTLGRLIRQLLDVSRFEAGGGKLETRQLVLADFLADLERAFMVLAQQRGVQFYVQRAAGIPTEVVWDADRMNEVLGNLLSNAFKFTDRGGRVELAVSANGESLHMDVRDTGAGIPPDQLTRIFDKFYQADNQQRAAAKGTGLGLAIAKGIVEAHNGTIGVESTPGVGTIFSICLPSRIATTRRTTASLRAVAVTE